MLDIIIFERLIKFCLVGCSGVVLDFGITYICKEWFRLNRYISNSLGFLCAASSNYILNRVWTFVNNNPHIAEQYMQFIGFSLIGLLINNMVIYTLQRLTKLNFYITKLIATAIVMLWNFSMNYLFTFE